MRDYYEILGVDRGCDDSSLKAAFRKMAMEHHPDRNGGCEEASGRFKEVNDQYGHEAGNDILRAVAGEIRNAVRASDVAARYGGDEFVVILTRTDLAGGARVAEALRAGIEGTGRRLGYPPGLITVSIGLAEFDPKEPAEVDLLVSADRALYRAKAAGRNAVA